MNENPKLYASLYDALDKWVEKACEEDYMSIDVLWPDKLVHLMTASAFGVIETLKADQEFLHCQGYMKDE